MKKPFGTEAAESNVFVGDIGTPKLTLAIAIDRLQNTSGKTSL